MKRHTLVGDGKIGEDALLFMRNQGGTWAAYQNVDLSSRMIGTLRLMKVGPGCTFETPPERMPDSPKLGPGWQYYFVGFADLEAGEIRQSYDDLNTNEKEEDRHADQSDKG